MFENKLTSEGISYSRYAASWRKTGKPIIDHRAPNTLFWKWLKSRNLSDEECWGIVNLATCGKVELEDDARKFVKAHSEMEAG